MLILALMFFTCGEAPDLSEITGGIDAIIPDTTIDSHEAIFDNSTVTLSWEGTNEYTAFFSYRLEPLSYLDTVDTYTSWSDWSTETTKALYYLDEGSYKFYVKGRVNAENEQTDPTVTPFEVDAITESALRMYPLKQTVSPSETFNIYLYADDINAVTGIEVQINLSNNNIVYNHWIKGAIFNTTGESSAEGEYTIGGVYSIFPPPTVENSTIILSGVVSGDGLSGKDLEIIKFTFTNSSSASTNTDITIHPINTFFRDIDNNDIPIVNKVSGIVGGI